ncbi:hypothetical protein PYCC9005_005644 [Savitreella phatthalungensis]
MADDTLRGNIVLETNMVCQLASASLQTRNLRLTSEFSHQGDIELELYWDHAPRACLNMQSLAERGYYDGCPFHRVVAGFAIQTGDPSGSGRGGESAFGGEAFGDEIHGELSHTGAGILSMANAGPDTNGSQFFITLAPTPCKYRGQNPGPIDGHVTDPDSIQGSTASTPSSAGSTLACTLSSV